MKRRLAKGIYWLAGKMGFKVYSQTYRVVSFDPFLTEPAGRTWVPNRFSMTLLRWSMRLDWNHWSHWACVHEHCDPVTCEECGSPRCSDECKFCGDSMSDSDPWCCDKAMEASGPEE